MQVFTMVVLIVAISCGTAIFIEYLKHRRLAERRSAAHDAVLERLDSLAERVAALEAIVTDQRFELSREFDRLERRA